MSKHPQTRVIVFPRRRSTVGGRCALPVRAAVAVLAVLVAAGAAFAAPASGKFCGFDLTKPAPVGGKRRLENLVFVHARLDFEREYEEYHRRPAGVDFYSGFILWGYKSASGFEPLYFVPANVPADDC